MTHTGEDVENRSVLGDGSDDKSSSTEERGDNRVDPRNYQVSPT